MSRTQVFTVLAVSAASLVLAMFAYMASVELMDAVSKGFENGTVTEWTATAIVRNATQYATVAECLAFFGVGGIAVLAFVGTVRNVRNLNR